MELLNTNKEQKTISFRIACSKGTYIRSLCEDVSAKLGTVGFMKNLRRTIVGEFKIEDAFKINEIKEKNENNDYSYIIPVEKIFENKPKIELSNKELQRFLNGVKILSKDYKNAEIVSVYVNKKFIGTGIIKENTLKRDIVLDN